MYLFCNHPYFIARFVGPHLLDGMLKFITCKQKLVQHTWFRGSMTTASRIFFQHVRKIICNRLIGRCRDEAFDGGHLLPIMYTSQEPFATSRFPSSNFLPVKFANSEAKPLTFISVTGSPSTTSHLSELSGITKLFAGWT